MIAKSPQSRPLPSPTLLREELAALAPELAAGSETFRAGVLLLAGLYLGQNVDRLARYLGESPAFVAKCARRLVDNGVWRAGETVGTWCCGQEVQDFWKDVAVAEGRLCRRIAPNGTVEWAPPGAWTKRFSYVASAVPEDVCVSYADREHAPAPEREESDGVPSRWPTEPGNSPRAALPAELAAPERLCCRTSWRLGTPRRPRFRDPLPLRPVRSASLPASPPHDSLFFPDLFPGTVWIR